MPVCQSPPDAVQYAQYRLSNNNKTATYQCDTGYTGDTTELVSRCDSKQPDDVPWTWSFAEAFRCAPGNRL